MTFDFLSEKFVRFAAIQIWNAIRSIVQLNRLFEYNKAIKFEYE